MYNEEAALEASVRRLHVFCAEALPWSFRIVIADNASEDRTPRSAGAWRTSWTPSLRPPQREGARPGAAPGLVGSDADVLAYMDVDLSTGLEALLPLVAPLISGHSDLAIGTRLARGSRVVRGPKRELISRTYNRILHWTLRSRFSDAQCGFKAGRAARSRRSCRWSRTRPGSSTPSCWSSPSAPACGSTKCRSTGSTTPTRGSTSSAPRSTTCAGSSASAAS